MPGPCVEDSHCIHLATNPDTANLRADIILDSDPTNSLKCRPTDSDPTVGSGLYTPKTRTRYVEQTANPLGSVTGVSDPLGVMTIDIDAFSGAATADLAVMITNTSTLAYTNDSGLPESVDFGVVMGESEYHLGPGWSVQVGVQMGWDGPALLPVVSAFQVNTGLITGLNAFAPVFASVDHNVPLGVDYPPYQVRQHTVMEPGETINIDYRMWARYNSGVGAPRFATGDYLQVVRVYFGAQAWLRAWTRDG